MKCMGWGSPSKRPHSWVIGHDSPQHPHQGAGQYADDVNKSPSRISRYNAHQGAGLSGHQMAGYSAQDGGPKTRLDYRKCPETVDIPGERKAVIRNLKCRSMIEGSEDLYKMYEYPPPPSHPSHSDNMYSYETNGNHMTGSHKHICNEDSNQRSAEFNSNFYGSTHCNGPTSKYRTYGFDPYNNVTGSTGLVGSTGSTGPGYYHQGGSYGPGDNDIKYSNPRSDSRHVSNEIYRRYSDHTKYRSGDIDSRYRSTVARPHSDGYVKPSKHPDNYQSQNNNGEVDCNVNQLDWSPEKATSSGSSFDSGYHSTHGVGANKRDCVRRAGDQGPNREPRPSSNHVIFEQVTSSPYHAVTTTKGSYDPVSSKGPYHQGIPRGPYQQGIPIGPHKHNPNDPCQPAIPEGPYSQGTPHIPYQLVHKVGTYEAGIKRTLDKCEDRCVKVIHPSHIWAEQQSEWESIIPVKVNTQQSYSRCY